MCIAAAIAGAAILGAGATIYASDQASGATQKGYQSASDVQRAALDQQAKLAAPYTGLGQSAMDQYKALLGIGPQGQAGIAPTLQNLPGYQFAKQQGLDATKAAASTVFGGGPSGNLLQGIDQFSTGLADQTYGAELNRLLAPIQIGQGAAAGQAANIQTGASNLGNIAIGAGNTQAGIDANMIAGITRSLGGGVNNYLTYQTLQNLQGGGGGYTPQDYGAAPADWATGGQTGNLTYGEQVAAGF